MTRAVFLDRDGVIVEDTGYVHKIEDFQLIPNVCKALLMLNQFELFIVTNQSGIGRGYYSTDDFLSFNKHLLNELKNEGIKIRKTYYCPHTPEDNCECRKPKTKMIKDAESEFKIDLSKSFMVGDLKSDWELGKNAGCKTIHVLTGHGNNNKDKVKPDYIAVDLLDAARWIIQRN